MLRSTPRWVWAAAVLFLVAGGLPFVIGWLAAPSGSTFTGVVLNVNDTNSYYADMQLGQHGRWLYVLPYTAQPNEPVPLFLVYILLGHIARLTALSIPLVYHAARLVTGGVFVITVYWFFAARLQTVDERRFALILVLFTGGLGWAMFALFGTAVTNEHAEFTPDIWIADAISFMALLNNVHFLLNVIFMMIMITTGQTFITSGARLAGLIALLAGLGIGLVHAHQVAVVGVVLGGVTLWHTIDAARDSGCVGWRDTAWHSLRTAAAWRFAGLMLPVVAVAGSLTLLARSDPALASWLEQGDTYSPPIYALFILYGPVLPLALIGLWHVIHTRDHVRLDAALWFGAALILIYVPVNFQRRFMEGWHVPIALLATLGWFHYVVPWLRQRWSRRAVRRLQAALIVSVMLSPLLAFTGILAQVLWSDSAFIFVSADEQGAIEWLDDHATLDDVVLGSYETGNQLAARVGVRVFAGHWSLTAHIDDRRNDLDRFFARTTPDADRRALLATFGVDYVWFGEDERALGGFDMAADYLEQVYASPTVTLYAVRLDQ
jgi:hypothetical protein